jgi:predicted RNA binding protein YcfA (HicA-like mRNA interferase family)
VISLVIPTKEIKIMSAADKTWIKLKEKPFRADITMQELHTFMIKVGFILKNQNSSHRKYGHELIPSGIIIPCHDPRKEVLPVYVKKIHDYVIDLGLLD